MNNLAPLYLKQLIRLKDGLQSLRDSHDYFLLEFPALPKTLNGYRRFSYIATNANVTLIFSVNKV